MSREQILLDFVPEAFDLIQDSENVILEIEKILEINGAYDDMLINNLFRSFHTIKGSSGLLKLGSIVKLTHEGETLLDFLRKESKLPNQESLQILLSICDHLKKLFQEIEIKKVNPELDVVAIELITRLKEEIKNQSQVSQSQYKKTPFEIFDEPIIENQVTENNANNSRAVEPIPKEDNVIIPAVDVIPNQLSKLQTEISNQNSTIQIKKEIKVTNEKLDLLMDIMGELVIAESNVTQHSTIKKIKNDSFDQCLNRLRKIVLDLQEVVLSTRMIPISVVFQRMTRLVRDLQKKSNKKVLLHIEGDETQIDKSVVDLIADPIIHILRNSVDHGIESSGERILAGKSEVGNIYLSARQSVNEVWILIQDDGHGLDRERILNKARENGLFSGDPSSLSDKEVFLMIFSPGLSTAKEVTNISGRGVGMDIVRQNIEKLGGKIDIQSISGRGTTFILRIPLTLGIMEGTVVRIGNNYFTIQTIELKEFVSLRNKEGIILEAGKEVYDVRGKFIPIFNINQILNHRVPLKYDDKDKLMVILEYEKKLLGIRVDEVIGNQNVVIKPLQGKMEEAGDVSGFTILGSGNVSLILDVKSIFQKLQGMY